ncbi:MAG TPA: class I tRNA ligase family protein, partial [Acetobacteraceae bacterium]|nr:class I tRNA ligase family protein [Acetobacteraceae bacterium]
MNDAPADYRDTVFLPRTNFPMRGELPKREPEFLARWARMRLFERLREAAKDCPPFILHDGPPYANGNLHIGHALNKIHKDVINRARQMAGYDANYVPGWDCHGLPIEWRIEEQYRKKGRDKDEVPVLDFRRECREYAAHWMAVQAEEFRRLGIEGDWAHRYATMDFASEAAIAAEIHEFVRNGALYRGLRPVLWSPVEKTALAEAEVEYQDRKDTAIWVRFPIIVTPVEPYTDEITPLAKTLSGASVVIWTTTPWTIPGNRAIAAGANIEYVDIVVRDVEEGSLAQPNDVLRVAEELRHKFCADVGITSHEVIPFPVWQLRDLICAHPLRGCGYD